MNLIEPWFRAEYDYYLNKCINDWCDGDGDLSASANGLADVERGKWAVQHGADGRRHRQQLTVGRRIDACGR